MTSETAWTRVWPARQNLKLNVCQQPGSLLRPCQRAFILHLLTNAEWLDRHQAKPAHITRLWRRRPDWPGREGERKKESGASLGPRSVTGLTESPSSLLSPLSSLLSPLSSGPANGRERICVGRPGEVVSLLSLSLSLPS